MTKKSAHAKSIPNRNNSDKFVLLNSYYMPALTSDTLTTMPNKRTWDDDRHIHMSELANIPRLF